MLKIAYSWLFNAQIARTAIWISTLKLYFSSAAEAWLRIRLLLHCSSFGTLTGRRREMHICGAGTILPCCWRRSCWCRGRGRGRWRSLVELIVFADAPPTGSVRTKPRCTLQACPRCRQRSSPAFWKNRCKIRLWWTLKAASVATDDVTSGSAHQAVQSMQDQNSPKLMAPKLLCTVCSSWPFFIFRILRFYFKGANCWSSSCPSRFWLFWSSTNALLVFVFCCLSLTSLSSHCLKVNFSCWKCLWIYYKFISDIIVNDYTTKQILKSWHIFKNYILFYI